MLKSDKDFLGLKHKDLSIGSSSRDKLLRCHLVHPPCIQVNLSPTQIYGNLSYCCQDSANRKSSYVAYGERYYYTAGGPDAPPGMKTLKRKHVQKEERQRTALWEGCIQRLEEGRKSLKRQRTGDERVTKVERKTESAQYNVLTAPKRRVFICRGETPL